MIYEQKEFNGGLNLLSSDTKVSESGYVWLVNGRSRYNSIDPIKKPLELADAPAGLKQGIIAVGNILVIFVAGLAYYRKDGTTDWIQIPGFLMSANEKQYWTQPVPYSTANFKRSLAINKNIHAPIVANNDFKILGTPSAIVVQDSVNQPFLILYDSVNQVFTSRVSKNYNQWQNSDDTLADREYVPIGREMFLFNGNCLHVVTPDRKAVMRSITGRPLDFMINVDENGNKLPTELLGGAITLSYAFDYDDITCIHELDIPDSFVYGTSRFTRIITADYSNTLFGEPTFRVAAGPLGAGIVNHYSFTDSLGDFVMVALDGVKSFNAVQQLKFKGSNSIFSLQLTRLLVNMNTKKPIRQRFCSIVNFDNYLLCNLDTYWGNIIAVFDQLTNNWVSLDITKVARIKQYTILDNIVENKLYCITEDNKVFQMFGEVETEVPELRVRGYVSQQVNTDHKTAGFRCVFDGGTTNGVAVLREFVDDQEKFINRINETCSVKDLEAQKAGVNYPVRCPVIPNNAQHTQNVSFPLAQGLTGKRISFILQWTNDSSLIELEFIDSEEMQDSSQQQKNQAYANSDN